MKITKTKSKGNLNKGFVGKMPDRGYRQNYSESEGGRFPSNFIYTGCDEVFNEFDKAGYSKSKKSIHKIKDGDGQEKVNGIIQMKVQPRASSIAQKPHHLKRMKD